MDARGNVDREFRGLASASNQIYKGPCRGRMGAGGRGGFPSRVRSEYMWWSGRITRFTG